MHFELNDDPSLPDWDGDAELTPWQQMRARISMDWARVMTRNDVRPNSMEACERAARWRRLRMTPRERADDDRARARVADLNRAHAARGTRNYLRSQGWMYGLANPDPTRAEVLAATRIRTARQLGMDERALRQSLDREDHDGFDEDELRDPAVIAMARSPIERACDLLESCVAERPLTYAEILATDPATRKELLDRDGQRVYHVLVVGDDGMRPDAESRMPAAWIAHPPRDPIYDDIRCRSDGPTLLDMLWPLPEVQVRLLQEVVAKVAGGPAKPVDAAAPRNPPKPPACPRCAGATT